jgi:hypothetical protein
VKPRRTRAVPMLAAIAIAVSICATPAIAGGRSQARDHASRSASGSASIKRLAVRGSSITVVGAVRLTNNTGAVRRGTRVLITATAASASPERRTVKVSRQLTYSATWSTGLTGTVTVAVRATVGGKASGRTVRRTVTIAQAVTPPAGGTALIGTFKLDPGSAPSGQAPTGSYFEMLTAGGGALANLSSPAPDKNYTPLTPGTAGGFSTTAYQPAPSPAFSGGTFGNALADEIIEPVPFYLIDFSVETSATDVQTGTPDPLPKIVDTGGTLSGQITAWVAQWNGQSFNQGTPKPNGTLPAPTTALTGTYDAATHGFTLAWKSLIVGGPFNGFTGSWHLAGTFVPAAGSSGSSLLPPLPLPLPLVR